MTQDDEFAAQDARRLIALDQLGILDTPPEQRFDDIVALVRTICRTPVALLTLVAGERQWFKAGAPPDMTETPIGSSVCALAIRQHDLFVISDLAVDPRTADMPVVAGEPHIRFYAGAPLITSAGVAIGSLCAIDLDPRPDGLTEEQGAALATLARQAMTMIELGQAIERRELALAASHGVGTWDWEVQADRFTADARFARLYAIDPEIAAGGAPIARCFVHIHPDDLPGLQASVAGAIAGGEVCAFEFRIADPAEGVRWLRAEGRCLRDAEGRPTRFPGVAFDITARKTAEARQEALLKLSDRFADCDAPAEIAFESARILGETLNVSRVGYGAVDVAAEKITVVADWRAPGIAALGGRTRFRDYGDYIEDLKRGATVIFTDAEAQASTPAAAAALRAIDARAFVNMPVLERGELVVLLFLSTAEPRAWTPEEILFIREVAERTRGAVERRRVEGELEELAASLERQVEDRTHALLAAEEQLRQSQKMEAVGQLTGGLAHDFNNMLTGISGAIEMMQVRIAQGRIGELERYASAAQGAAKRAAALTHRLLAFSRRQTLDPKPTDVNRLITGLEELIRRTVGPSVEVEVVGAAGLWTAMVDPNQLENALLNLCINARDAMPGGGRITIETANKWLDGRAGRERDLDPGQYLSLCVTDTGGGMTPEVQARAFDPFYTTKPLGEGTGLGLSMIYGFARQSGGQVRIYSEIGIGTTMCIYLPRHYGEADPEFEGLAVEHSPHAGASQTVLVVDDEPTIRMLVAEVLEELGYAVLEAHDGTSALGVLQSDARIDLLVTDVGLPGAMNGRQIADAARVSRPDLKILFITGYAENAVIGGGQLATGMGLITKPFAMDALALKLREMLASG